MRHRKAQATAGQVSGRNLLSRQTFTFGACLVVGLWVCYTFAQEALLSHQLNQQETQLRQQNAQLKADNDSYRRDVLSIASGSAVEEEARLNGYARPDEKVFVVVGAGSVPSRSAPKASPAAAR